MKNYNHTKQLTRYEHLMCSDSTSRRQSEPEFPEGHSVRHQLLGTFTILHLEYTTPVLRFFIPSQPPSVSSKNLRKIDRILIATTRAKACIFQASTELWSCFATGIVRTNALLLGFHEPEGQVGCHQGVCQDVTGWKERFFWVPTHDLFWAISKLTKKLQTLFRSSWAQNRQPMAWKWRIFVILGTLHVFSA